MPVSLIETSDSVLLLGDLSFVSAFDQKENRKARSIIETKDLNMMLITYILNGVYLMLGTGGITKSHRYKNKNPYLISNDVG